MRAACAAASCERNLVASWSSPSSSASSSPGVSSSNAMPVSPASSAIDAAARFAYAIARRSDASHAALVALRM